MTSAAEWNNLLRADLSWQDCYPEVSLKIRAYLDQLPPGYEMRTADLVEALYPAKIARGVDGNVARGRLFKVLAGLSKHDLETYCTKGARQRLKLGRMGRPLRWHCHKPKPVCPTCGQVLPNLEENDDADHT